MSHTKFIPVIIISLITLLLVSMDDTSFKSEQKKHPRVKQAYADKEKVVRKMFQDYNIDPKTLRIYLRAFKTEGKVELWAKNNTDITYKLIREYKICQSSGTVGPKRMEGDMQVPEGFYHINHFNPQSNFYLSLGINYPNRSDRILGKKGKPGGAIYIHGACVTIGCIPITDEFIKELYIVCIEARESRQQEIPVTIFPAELTTTKYKQIVAGYSSDTDKLGLWADLKKAYDFFEKNKDLPSVRFLANGRHSVGE